MADELGMVLLEDAGAEDVVGVNVGHHHIADWDARDARDVGPQALAVLEAPAGVNHGDGVPAYDEADVGDGVVVGCGSVFVQAATDEDSGGDFLEGERGGGFNSPTSEGWHARGGAEGSEGDSAACHQRGGEHSSLYLLMWSSSIFCSTTMWLWRSVASVIRHCGCAVSAFRGSRGSRHNIGMSINTREATTGCGRYGRYSRQAERS